MSMIHFKYACVIIIILNFFFFFFGGGGGGGGRGGGRKKKETQKTNFCARDKKPKMGIVKTETE